MVNQQRCTTGNLIFSYKSFVDGCISFVKQQAEEIGLEFHEVKLKPPGLFAIWATWKGSDPGLKSIMLNCHAFKDDKGNIYGRGTQDMKSVGIQYLEAIRKLKAKGFIPKNTVHVTFVPGKLRTWAFEVIPVLYVD